MRILPKLLYLKGSGHKANAVRATEQLLAVRNVRVTRSTIIKTLENHPYYPSLLSISDALHQWRIANFCIRVEANKLKDLPAPFIAHLNVDGGHFVTVLNVSENEVVCAENIRFQ